MALDLLALLILLLQTLSPNAGDTDWHDSMERDSYLAAYTVQMDAPTALDTVLSGPFLEIENVLLIDTPRLSRSGVHYGGITLCWPDGSYYTLIATGRDGWRDSLVHELIHAYDCTDNGSVDGSPLVHAMPANTEDPAHWYVDQVLEMGSLSGSFSAIELLNPDLVIPTG